MTPQASTAVSTATPAIAPTDNGVQAVMDRIKRTRAATQQRVELCRTETCDTLMTIRPLITDLHSKITKHDADMATAELVVVPAMARVIYSLNDAERAALVDGFKSRPEASPYHVIVKAIIARTCGRDELRPFKDRVRRYANAIEHAITTAKNPDDAVLMIEQQGHVPLARALAKPASSAKTEDKAAIRAQITKLVAKLALPEEKRKAIDDLLRS